MTEFNRIQIKHALIIYHLDVNDDIDELDLRIQF